MKRYESIEEFRNAASDGHDYTNEQIRSLLVDELKRKAHRRGLKSGLIFGTIIGVLLVWAIQVV